MIQEQEISGKKTIFRDRRQLTILAALLVIVGLGTFLRFYNLGAFGVGNTYYAAAVKSMLMTWKNFFFVAFEPGGTVSIDKPPLGFWVQAISAYFLGVNGFALALPNALAGVFSILLVYRLLQEPFGPWAALLGALALAVMPVAVATERNNTIDGLLVFVLLLAAWAFVKAVQSGRARWVFLGALIVGLGFNIKMLQAYLPLPAFYALYFWGSRHPFWKKTRHLAIATVILVLVSFSWATLVDLTPKADRPYVDSTSGNSVFELIFNHNGIERFTNGAGARPGGAGGPAGAGGPGAMGFKQPANNDQNQSGPIGVNGAQNNPTMGAGQPGPFGGGGGPGGMDFGSAGIQRLLSASLAGEASWLLPFSLGALILGGWLLRKRPIGPLQVALILWGGWLIPEALYFSFSQGTMHPYYLIMMGPPIAGLFGAGAWAFGKMIQTHKKWGWSLLLVLAGITLAFQDYLLVGKSDWTLFCFMGGGLLFLTGLVLGVTSLFKSRLAPAAIGFLLSALIAGPLTWSLLTTYNTSSSEQLPTAGPNQMGQMGPGNNGSGNGPFAMGRVGGLQGFPAAGGRDGSTMRPAMNDGRGSNNDSLTKFLLANTQPGTYLLATGGANEAAGYILSTGRPVLALGGFLGQYDELPLERFTSLVTSGKLRYVLGGALGQHQAISQWVQNHCELVDGASQSGNTVNNPSSNFGDNLNSTLYDCGN